MVGQHPVGMAGCHRGIEQLGEKGAWIGTATGSEFLVVVPPVGPAVAASSTLPFRSTRAGGNWGMEARRSDAEAVNLPAGRSPLPRLVGGEGRGRRRTPEFADRSSPSPSKGSSPARGDGPRELRITVADREVGHVLQALISAEWSQLLPPMAAQVLNTRWALAVLGRFRFSSRAPARARLRSFWCRLMRKPGSKVPLTMRSPCTSRIREEAKPPISAFAHLGRIGAVAGGEQQGLGDRLDVQRDDDLVGHLGGLAVAVAADAGDVLAHRPGTAAGRVRRCSGSRRP